MQDTVQGFNWNNTQAAIYQFVVYYLSHVCHIQCSSYWIISDCLKNDINAIRSCIKAVVTDLQEHVHLLNKCIYFSVGAGPQYKNYNNFTNLCHHQSDFKVNAEWHFFETSRGKSPCDDIGGSEAFSCKSELVKANKDKSVLFL